MDLQTAIQETQCALNLVLNNKFSQALDLLKPWWKDSMYHALGYSSILVMQATMTFEQRDIQAAMATIKETLQTCQRFRKRNSVVGSLSSLISKQTNLQEEEMHAELCYAECLLQKATLTFVQDENMISFIKGGIKIRTSYQIYKDCQNLLSTAQGVTEQSDLFRQFEGGVKLGIGSFNLTFDVIGFVLLCSHPGFDFGCFSGCISSGIHHSLLLGSYYFSEGKSGKGLNLFIGNVKLIVHVKTAETFLDFSEHVCFPEHPIIVRPFWSQTCLFRFLPSCHCGVLQARARYEECISSQQEWKQIHHLCYWELMWNHSFQQEWQQAYRYADLLCRESRWSKAIYVYQKAAILSMMSAEELERTGEDLGALFRSVEGLKQRLAGKSIPMEKFAVRKSRRYKASNPVPLVIPALEMMYVWNGFSIVGKRADLTESLLVTIERVEQQLQNDPNPTEYHPDDSCLVQMLKGLCLKYLGRFLQAELCFSQVLSSEGRIRYDHYLVPFTLYELGLLQKQQGDFIKATTYIERAKMNYKDYSMESRLHFRIHAALNSLKGSPVSTP
uniref:Tetratricopeptide repeat protein 39B n=1 Tax=Oryzias melastigma TaxID=30732 RepID=A0A3B3DZE3_ORYME